MRVAAALAAAAIVALGAPAPAHATPKQDLERGRAEFRARDFESAMHVLSYLLYPVVQLGDRDDTIEAYILLGASSYETGNRERAAKEFKQALQLDPERSITTLNFSDGAVKVFDDTKAELVAQLARDAEAKKLAEERARIEAYRKSLVYVERRSYGVNFLPFGAGQFQLGYRRRGLLFAASEGVTGVTSLGIFLYLAGEYGLVNHNLHVSTDTARNIRTLQTVEIVSGGAFLGLYILGVLDAIYHYKPRAQIEGDDSLLPPDMRKSVPKKPKQSLLDRVHVGPMIFPNGAGIGVSWENH